MLRKWIENTSHNEMEQTESLTLLGEQEFVLFFIICLSSNWVAFMILG